MDVTIIRIEKSFKSEKREQQFLRVTNVFFIGTLSFPMNGKP